MNWMTRGRVRLERHRIGTLEPRTSERLAWLESLGIAEDRNIETAKTKRKKDLSVCDVS
jgi:hypothetical protein